MGRNGMPQGYVDSAFGRWSIEERAQIREAALKRDGIKPAGGCTARTIAKIA